jgi:3D (Asp-Asp-Asp) domain-containing protein
MTAAHDLALADLAQPDLTQPIDLFREDLSPGTSKGTVTLTYYWVTEESDYSGADDTALCDVSANVIAMVPLAFANALKIEGTGKLSDGRLLNIGGSCACSSGMTTCYITLDQTKYPWGVGVQSRPLVPFRSIAVDKSFIPYGTHVYIPEFDGVQMPSSFVHDGCFEADDTGGGIVGAHIDFFAAEKKNYLTLDGMLNLSSVTAFVNPPRCP